MPEFDLHLIVDNDATHKHAAVKAWEKVKRAKAALDKCLAG